MHVAMKSSHKWSQEVQFRCISVNTQRQPDMPLTPSKRSRSGDPKTHLKAIGLVRPSPRTRDSVMSMLSERIMGTTCLNKEEGDGMLTICTNTHTQRLIYHLKYSVPNISQLIVLIIASDIRAGRVLRPLTFES